MTATPLPAEFTLVRKHTSDRTSPARWVVSHALRYWPILILIVIGAYGNGALAGIVPTYVGQAFDGILAVPPRWELLIPLTLAIGGSQVLRGCAAVWQKFWGGVDGAAHRTRHPG